ncbi:MAG TPA: glycosyl transferase family 2 [Porphyromonadaceae bacterium]|nr:glycosyl transferase family 2 [Porphyromonadaceae bacterium]
MLSNAHASLIIATYNNPAYLRLSLNSLLNQVDLPFEVIIADDGSTQETYELIAHFKKIFPVPIIHIWQPDNGFQLGRIRNIAVAAANSDYIIQIDGDIIMEPHFIKDHLFHKKANTLLQGSRVMITEQKAQELMNCRNVHLSFFSNGLKRKENAIRSRLLSTYLSTRYRNRYPVYYARGCNMSFYRKDFIAVNGYNNEFVGWGHEDSELTLRMLNNGCKKDYIKFHCVAYHLYHEERSRSDEGSNKELMDKQFSLSSTWCEDGVDQYLTTFKDYIKQ